ncbi:hypothetical protein ACFL6P_02720 [Candidatus Latescibacterota bacterium]
MVRPIEISGLLSKTQEAVRMQQNAEMRPEAAQEFRKALSEKLNLHQTHAPSPTAESDQVVLHVDEREKEKRETAEDHMNDENEHEPENEDENKPEDMPAAEPSAPERSYGAEDDDSTPSGHIDIKI